MKRAAVFAALCLVAVRREGIIRDAGLKPE
jgi:hypothetical protein